MNYSQALKWGQEKLKKADIATSRLDSLILLEDNLNIDRAKILSEPSTTIQPSVLSKYQAQINKRQLHLPLAYIRKKSAFYGRDFFIDKRVLQPRPESEALIDELKIITNNTNCSQIIDIGTGSGALAITAKLEFARFNVIGTDINSKCLDVATINAQQLSSDISLLRGSLLKALPYYIWNTPTIIIANLPYVPDNWQINSSAMKEPAQAIFGGKDGLALYVKLFKQLASLNNPPLWVLCESMPPQHTQLTEIALKANYCLTKTNDFIQCFSLALRQASP
jgi:release factor glutamine methyltransferase